MMDTKKRDDVLMEAAGWLLRIEDGPPLSEAEESKFLAWLQSKPLHVRTYLSAARVARGLSAAYKEGPIQESVLDVLLVTLPKLRFQKGLGESRYRAFAEAMLKKLGQPLDQSDTPLPVAIRRK